MDFNEIRGQAEEFAKEHPDQVEGGAEKAGEFGKERFGHDEQIDQGVEKIDDWVPGGKGEGAEPPA